mgnify:CR=1 FL=1
MALIFRRPALPANPLRQHLILQDQISLDLLPRGADGWDIQVAQNTAPDTLKVTMGC